MGRNNNVTELLSSSTILTSLVEKLGKLLTKRVASADMVRLLTMNDEEYEMACVASNSDNGGLSFTLDATMPPHWALQRKSTRRSTRAYTATRSEMRAHTTT